MGVEALRLAVVEDEEAHFELMKRAIHREFPDASILHFNEANGCLEQLDQLRPNIIIADYLMPGMNGIEFMRVLSRERPDIPVIIITGQGDENIAVQAMKLGAKDYVVKSADFFTLLPSIIRKVIHERELEHSLRESARLNDLLLNSLPHPAMLIRRDRVVLAANRIALQAGATIGDYCWRSFGRAEYIPEEDKLYIREHGGSSPPEGTKCTFCLSDEALEQSRPANAPEVKVHGSLWDSWWIPIDRDTYLHYGLDITDRKLAEEHIHWLTQQLLKVQENERQRLSCDLHDVIGQELSSVKIGIDTLLDDQPGASEEIRARAARLSTMLQGTIMGVRNLAYNLGPATLEELGLVRTLHQYCEEFSSKAQAQVEFVAAGMDDLDLDFDTKITLYRLIQEGLNNVKNHADATIVIIRLVASCPSIILRMEDNGKGFDVQNRLISAFRERRMGLRSMEERVALLSGKMKIESRPNQGTRIHIEVPLKENKGEPKEDYPHN